ncbi:2'-5' RNA ligase family protein [Microbacterium sp. MYb72]|uniref:2'-5' RNA ligase family protein n=1 Tax=Microbacterium sp. MYb72 TaxID=1848693 RepID=UPI0021587874|nr:2'-5' RNA ligase family protein [Microbacterium sp. MYb72]
MRRPFMDTPDQLASLQGQQYLVLRPSAAVAHEYESTQRALLDGPARDLKHPHTGHVTLRGFFEAGRREEVAGLVREWAAEQPPIEVTADAVDAFPSPWQVVILRAARSASLVQAYSRLTDRLEPTDYRRLDELSVDDWTFHLSLVYARSLGAAEWEVLERAARRAFELPPTETITEAEFVWYDEGGEYAEIIPLGG